MERERKPNRVSPSIPLLIAMLFVAAIYVTYLLGLLPLAAWGYLLKEVKGSVVVLYQGNLEYLWTILILAFEIHIFTRSILSILRRNTLPKEKRGGYGPLMRYLLWLFVIGVKYSLMLMREFRKPFRSKRRGAGERLDEDYLLGSLTFGVLASILLILAYEAASPVDFWTLFVICLLILLSYMGTLGKVIELDERSARELGIGYKSTNLVVTYGVERPVRFTLDEKIIALGLSVGAGICGVVTTLGSTILHTSISFALVPATFDMLSLLTALIEPFGIRMIPQLFRELKMVRIGLLTMLLVISWSLYLSGGLALFLVRSGLPVSANGMVMLVSGLWVLMAVASSVLVRSFKPRSIFLVSCLSLLPVVLLLV